MAEEQYTIKSKYGFVPRSVLYFVKDEKLTGFFDDSHRDISLGGSMLTGKMSEFNSTLAEFVVKYWSNVGAVILDPFHGWGTRAVVSYNLGRRYIGFDISKVANEFISAYFNSKVSLTSGFMPTFFLSDGCKLEGIPASSVDLVFTCPPYFNIEKYESGQYQLSDINNYNYFLLRMSQCARACYSVLKDGSYCIIVAGDWRVDGELKLFGKDIIEVFLRVGFLMHDFIVHKLNSVNILGCGEFERNGFVCKSHEYVLVFKKVLGQRTANVHVNSILNNLDVDSAEATSNQPISQKPIPFSSSNNSEQLVFSRQI